MTQESEMQRSASHQRELHCKNVYKQIVANPKICICAMKPQAGWVRVRATAVDAPQEIVDKVFADSPFLKTIYNEETGEVKFGDIGADAQVNVARGVVITNAQIDPMPEETAKVAHEYFGPDGRHGEDYIFYYNNIKDNVNKRVAAYLANR